ncbi:segregation and condensation protein A [Streptomyces sp. NBC_00344]|uniref:segregation and condensation protein A n=1 Tax=Streptomyces sp. NBC_00344 TaxID=2975720 RepID=UPI002E22F112
MPTDESAQPRRRTLGRGPGAVVPAEAAAPESAAGSPPEPEAPEGDTPPAVDTAPAGAVPDDANAVEAGAVPEAAPARLLTAEHPGDAVPGPPVPEAATGGPDVSGPVTDSPDVFGPVTGNPDVSEPPTGLPPRGSDAPETADEPHDGRFRVRLVNFEGPFDLLLQLISKHRLDVTEIALSKVTVEFMAHIRSMGADWDLDQATEFLVVAATLLDLKAARLLPAAEIEDEADLALLEARDLLFARLLQYRAYKQIAEIFSDRLEAEGRRYPRTVGLEPHHAALLPEVVIRIGAEGFAKLAVKAMQPRARPQIYVDHIHAPLVSVQEQAEIVMARLRQGGDVSFRTLTEDAEDTLTVVARFLALLELYREKAVVLDQEEALGELLVRWTGGDGPTPAVTDEFDRLDHVVEEKA